MAYQPIVELTADGPGPVVGYEALARWPDEPELTPAAVFGDAADEQLRGELDWRCRLAALEGALRADLTGGPALFVNVEPAALRVRPPAGAGVLIQRACTRLDVVVEITEREVLASPADLLATVEWSRRHGLRVALDDVGSDPESVAMLEFVRPDIVKLDLALAQQSPARDRARALMAVLAYCERSGAAILAEGIEDAEHYAQAWSLGATLGQGWLFGSPGPIDTPVRERRPLTRGAQQTITARTPFAIASATHTPRVAPRRLLQALGRDIERQALASLDTPVVLASFQRTAQLDAATRTRYARLAELCSMVVAYGVGMGPDEIPGGRSASLAPNDPLAAEWVIVVVDPHYAAALVARELPADGDDDPHYEFVVTHDRATVVAAGRLLLQRLTARRH